MDEKTARTAKIAVFLAALAFIFLIVYSPHFNYAYPYHTDEWHHIAEGMSLAEDGPGINPYFEEKPKIVDYEIGYHAFLSILFLFVNPVLFYKFLPALFACAAAAILFIFVRKISDFKTGIFSMLFFSTLRSNVNLLGLWFAVPMTFAIPFLYLLFYFIARMFEAENPPEKRKFLIFSFVIFFVLIASHAATAMFAVPVILAYFAYRMLDKLDREGMKALFSRKFLLIFIVSILLIIAAAFILFWKGSFAGTLNLFYDMMLFEKGFTSFELSYSPIMFYGPASFLLAMIGVISSLKNKKKMVFVFWFAVAAILLFVYSWTNVSLFAPYPRLFYFLLLSLAPLSAFGVSAVFGMLKKVRKKNLSILLIAVFIVFIILAFYSSFYYYYNIPSAPNLRLYQVIDNNDYRAIKWFGENYGRENVILAMPHISSAIYPISGNYVLAIYPARLGGGNAKEIESFFNISCEGKQNLITKYKPDFIFSKEKIECGFKEIYSDNDYIYDLREI